MTRRRADGLLDVTVDDEVAMKIATERLPKETDARTRLNVVRLHGLPSSCGPPSDFPVEVRSA